MMIMIMMICFHPSVDLLTDILRLTTPQPTQEPVISRTLLCYTY